MYSQSQIKICIIIAFQTNFFDLFIWLQVHIPYMQPQTRV